MSPAIPHLVFSTTAVEDGDRLEAWRQHLAPMFEAGPQVPGERLDATLEIYHLGQIMAGGVDVPEHHFRRDKAWAAKSDIDHYFLQIYLEGGYIGTAGARDAEVRAGDVEVLHMAQTFDTMASASRTFGVMIPRDLLDQRLGSAADLHGTILKREEPAAALLGGYLDRLRQLLPTATIEDVPMIAEGCIGLVAASLRPTADALAAAAPQVGAVLVDRILRHIDANVANADLGVASICAAFRISRSYLYRLMEPHGGVANMIRRRRLRRAMFMLTQPNGAGLRICDIAYACGFNDEKVFSRAFKAEFDLPPSDARQIPYHQAEGERPIFTRWITELGKPAS